MKKLILVLLSTLTLISTSQAQGFIGIDIGSTKLTASNGWEDKSVIYGMKAGAQTENWRTYVGFNYFNSELDQIEFYVSADYIFTDETQLIRPFIGGSVGFANTDDDKYDIDSSLTWGGQGGVLLNLDPHFNIEVGIKYMYFNMDSTVAYPYEYYNVFKDKLTLFVGANYKF